MPATERKLLTITPGAQHAPRGSELNCKDWHAEAALRMFLNNLDAEVAERPEDLVVYGGRGQAALRIAALAIPWELSHVCGRCAHVLC